MIEMAGRAAYGVIGDRGLFDDVVSLDDEEQEQLSQMLVAAPKASVYRQ